MGRKWVLLLSGLPLASSWVFIVCNRSVMWIYWSRVCSGIGSGMMWPAMSLYLGEIANPAIRGSLVTELSKDIASLELSILPLKAYTNPWMHFS